MNSFDPEKYGPACAAILNLPVAWSLGPGEPTEAARPLLANLSPQAMFPGATVRDAAMARCCISGLWLLHNYLDESHTISQEISSTSGSYWHGIMHRREPDYSNAKYWFRQVGTHAVFAPLAEAARQLASQQPLPGPASFLAEQKDWDPFRFVDLCEAAAGGQSDAEPLCQDVAWAECQLLFDYCYQQAAEQG